METFLIYIYIYGARPIYEIDKDEIDELKYSKPGNKVKIIYKSKNMNFTDENVTIKRQGDGSITNSKANFNIKFSSKHSFLHWPSDDTFVLKGDQEDGTHIGLVAGSRLWADIVKNREDYDTLPEGYKNSPMQGAIDGFPVKVYYIDDNTTDTHNVNASKKLKTYYDGVYMLIFKKSYKIMGLDVKNNPDVQAMLSTEFSSGKVMRSEYAVPNPRTFRELWGEKYPTSTKHSGINLEDGYSMVDGVNTKDTLSPNILNSINELITIVKDTDDETFKSQIINKIDLNGVIDYLIFSYVIGNDDAFGKNQLFGTYDGIKWYWAAYDFGRAFGCYVSPTVKFPENALESCNLLYERLWNLYPDKIKSRYFDLRNKVFKPDVIFKHIEDIYNTIGPELYEMDKKIFDCIVTHRGSTYRDLLDIESWITQRLKYCDVIFKEMKPEVLCMKLESSQSLIETENMSVDLSTYIVKTPTNATTDILYNSSPSSIGSVSGTILTKNKAGEVTITAHTPFSWGGDYPVKSVFKVKFSGKSDEVVEPDPVKNDIYIGVCNGNYYPTDINPNQVGKIEARIYCPPDYFAGFTGQTGTLPNGDGSVCGARPSVFARDEYSIKFAGTGDWGLQLCATKSSKIYAFKDSALGKLTVELSNDGAYMVKNEAETIYEHVTEGIAYPTETGCSCNFSLFDVANENNPTTQKKQKPIYINYIKFYDNAGQILRQYETRIITETIENGRTTGIGIPTIVETHKGYEKVINVEGNRKDGSTLIYYFTDTSDIKTYNPNNVDAGVIVVPELGVALENGFYVNESDYITIKNETAKQRLYTPLIKIPESKQLKINTTGDLVLRYISVRPDLKTGIYTQYPENKNLNVNEYVITGDDRYYGLVFSKGDTGTDVITPYEYKNNITLVLS